MINGEYMTLRQAAAYLNMSYSQFYCWRYNHSIKSYKQSINTRKRGRALAYVKKADIDAFKNVFVEVPNKRAKNESVD